ncbi:hypothetical protein [Clavibacter tessellarius]|uniref:hypothetical protein n=1 Tax=Clavibacter tessellarius TaxID=31965 RepID=UPI00324D50FA
MGLERTGRPATSADALERAIHDVARPVFVVETPEGSRSRPTAPSARRRGIGCSPRRGPSTRGASDRRRSARTTASAPRRWPGPWRAASRPSSLVSALARAGHLASYGAAGQLPERIDEAVRRIREAAPGRAFAVNVIHSPSEAALEEGWSTSCCTATSAWSRRPRTSRLTEPLVRYRLTGAHRDGRGRVRGRNRVIAKVSRPETARLFLAPAPEALVRRLRDRGAITEEEAALAPSLPMADDITVEADSGGRTDRRPCCRCSRASSSSATGSPRDSAPRPGWAPREGWGRRTPSPRRSRWAPSTW